MYIHMPYCNFAIYMKIHILCTHINFVLAATSVGTCMIVSSLATSSIEEVAKASDSGLRWFQMHVFNDKTFTANMMQKAEKAGYKALVITIDAPVLGRRLAGCRNTFNMPSHLKLPNFNTDIIQNSSVKSWGSVGSELYHTLMDSSLTWDTITWVKSITTLPVIVKGVLTAEDALLSVEHGVDGILVSNHGGRQLDGVLATVS